MDFTAYAYKIHDIDTVQLCNLHSLHAAWAEVYSRHKAHPNCTIVWGWLIAYDAWGLQTADGIHLYAEGAGPDRIPFQGPRNHGLDKGGEVKAEVRAILAVNRIEKAFNRVTRGKFNSRYPLMGANQAIIQQERARRRVLRC